MIKKTVGLYTLGCKVNQYETAGTAQAFRNAGYEIKDFDSPCDVYVINTCTVTGEASRKSGQYIRRAKRFNPEGIVVAMGCYTQIYPESVEADILIGTNDRLRAPELVEKFLIEGKLKSSVIRDSRHYHEFEEIGPVIERGQTRAFVKIEDGCNRFCSYCIIPFARGRVRSRKVEDILLEVMALREKGYKEIVLTGIDLSSFGSDRGESMLALSDLVYEINKISGIRRIRLGSLDPYCISQDFAEGLIKSEKLCPHFHLSLQSGSDSVLKRMNRKYTTKDFAPVMDRLKSAYPEAVFSVDIITGFPGETDEEHMETLTFCKEMNFFDIHVFKYSLREGTKAAEMPGQVPGSVASKRSKDLLLLAQEMKSSHLQKRMGEFFDILAETVSSREITGHTEDYMQVCVLTKAGEKLMKTASDTENRNPFVLPGDIISVKAIDVKGDRIIAEINE